MPTVHINGQDITIERMTLTKAMRVITLLSLIQKRVPEINRAMGEFRRAYVNENADELTRTEAKLRFGPQPVLGDDGEVMLRDDGEVLVLPSPIDRMTEQDWEQSGQVLKLRRQPSNTELLTAMFPLVYEHAEELVLRLLALVSMPNADVDRYVRSGEIKERMDERAQEVIAPAFLEEVMELAVTCAEQVEGQVMAKARELGDRTGKLRQLFGMGTTKPAATPTSNESQEQPNSGSASTSPGSSDGSPIGSSASRGMPFKPSGPSLTASAS